MKLTLVNRQKLLEAGMATRLGAQWPGQRCLAKTRQGTPCQNPVVTDRNRCRMHGPLRQDLCSQLLSLFVSTIRMVRRSIIILGHRVKGLTEFNYGLWPPGSDACLPPHGPRTTSTISVGIYHNWDDGPAWAWRLDRWAQPIFVIGYTAMNITLALSASL